MKKYFSVLAFLFLTVNVLAQHLRGIVLDADDGKPIRDVNVYLNGTMLRAKTDDNGSFHLRTVREYHSELVFSHVSYSEVIVANPFQADISKIYMRKRVNVLDEFSVVADRFTREQKLQAFRQLFLGTTPAGKACIIRNEDDIRFHYDAATRRFSASAQQPLIVENSYLGYEVSFDLRDFFAVFADKTLNCEMVQQSFLAGTSFYVDKNQGDAKIEKRRRNVYLSSSVWFFKNLTQNSLKASRHKVFNKSLLTDPYKYFSIRDTLERKLIYIKPGTDINTVSFTRPNYGKISVLYRREQSDILFTSDSIWVDNFGNLISIDNVIFVGAMSEHRVGDMLPIDYRYEQK